MLALYKVNMKQFDLFNPLFLAVAFYAAQTELLNLLHALISTNLLDAILTTVLNYQSVGQIDA